MARQLLRSVPSLPSPKTTAKIWSGTGDGTVRVWHTPTLSALYVVHPPHDNVGDIYSLAWVDHDLLEGDLEDHPSLSSPSKGKGRLYAGCQNNSIQVRNPLPISTESRSFLTTTPTKQWIELPPAFHIEAHSHPIGGIPSYLASSQLSSSPPIHRTPNKFFDSVALRDRPPSLNRNSNSTTSLVGLVGRSSFDREDSSGASVAEHVVELQFEDDHIAHYAHYGYVVSYCFFLVVGLARESKRTDFFFGRSVLPPHREEQRPRRPRLGLCVPPSPPSSSRKRAEHIHLGQLETSGSSSGGWGSRIYCQSQRSTASPTPSSPSPSGTTPSSRGIKAA